MAGFSTIQQKKNQLIRKAINGSAFLAPYTAPAITSLTSGTAGLSGTLSAATIVGATTLSSTVSIPAGSTVTIGGTGTETVVTTGAPTGAGPYSIPVPPLANAHASGATVTTPATINLTALPAGYQDAGWSTQDGINLAQAISVSETDSWGSVEPTRSDITKQTTTAKIVLQETKALTIGLYTGADLTAVQGDHVTSEVGISVPVVPSSKYYRCLALAVDSNDAGEIYIARFLPRVKVTDKDDQKLALDDSGITWGVTLTAYQDSVLGYSQRYLFAGPGWASILVDAGFTQA